MPSTQLDLPSERIQSNTGQVTRVEQARAVAEVQAAVYVAQQNPRSLMRAEADMRDVCTRMSMASRAFYSVPNRGTGPSVHLLRELARIWQNVQYGVHELARDDDRGESEIQAWAWDTESNVRSSRTFVVPHARMKGKDRQRLTDLNDIYLANQNIGARAVRECIATVLPTWFTESAQDLCRATLEKGEGVPLGDRISAMLKAFSPLGITQTQLEDRTGRRRAQWTPGDVAQLAIDFKSITRDGIDKDELFPPARVAVDDIPGRTAPADKAQPAAPASPTAAAPAPESEPAAQSSGPTQAMTRKLHALIGKEGITDRNERLGWLSTQVRRDITSSTDLTYTEVADLIGFLENAHAQDAAKAAQN